jgi:hypothetical protein
MSPAAGRGVTARVEVPVDDDEGRVRCGGRHQRVVHVHIRMPGRSKGQPEDLLDACVFERVERDLHVPRELVLEFVVAQRNDDGRPDPGAERLDHLHDRRWATSVVRTTCPARGVGRGRPRSRHPRRRRESRGPSRSRRSPRRWNRRTPSRAAMARPGLPPERPSRPEAQRRQPPRPRTRAGEHRSILSRP